MKFLSFLLCTVLILSITVSSFALELDEAPPSASPEYVAEEVLPEEDEVSVPEDEVSAPEDEEQTLAADTEVVEINPELGIEDGTITNVSVMSVAPITPEDTNGLKAVLLEVIGDYDPIIIEYEYQNSNNQYVSYLRDFLPDYPWCASFLMLALFVYCIFRLGGALIG